MLPDRFRYSSVQTDTAPGQTPLTMVSGFKGSELLTIGAKLPEDAVPKLMYFARLEFVRAILLRLPRKLVDVRLLQQTTHDAGQERIAISATLSNDLAGMLLVDPRTCIPAALQYTSPSPSGAATYRIDVSGYRRFGGILFPTVLKITQNGEPWEDEYDSDVQVNPQLGDEDFRSGGR
jgi:hypothetical protein